MRLLLVQFSSETLTKNESKQAKEYHDKLYRSRAGYNRFGPTWEIPVWIAEMKRNFVDADILFAESTAHVQSKQDNYTHLAFSALDCNWHLIAEIAGGFRGTVIVGGYCDPNYLQAMQSVIWFDSVKQCCETFVVEYKPGVDYTEFTAAKTIARLTLSTGCRHKCKFCVQPDVVKTPVNEVFQQADEICRLTSPLVYVNDKTFGQCENFWRLQDLFGYIARNMPIFGGFIIQTTPAQLLKLDDDFLLSAGVRYVELGIETYNNDILSAMHKPSNEKTIDAATDKLRRIGIRLIPNILIGLPGETHKTYTRTLQWLGTNRDAISHLNIYNLVVYADAELAGGFASHATDENSDAKAGTIHETFSTMLYAFATNCLDK